MCSNSKESVSEPIAPSLDRWSVELEQILQVLVPIFSRSYGLLSDSLHDLIQLLLRSKPLRGNYDLRLGLRRRLRLFFLGLVRRFCFDRLVNLDDFIVGGA